MRPQIKDIVNEIISPLNLIKVLAINGTNRKTQHADLNCKDVLKYSTVETAELSGAELLGLHCYPSAKVTELVQSLKVKVSEAKNLNYHLEGAEKNPLEVYLLARYLESYQSQDELFHYGNEFLANLNLHYKRNSLLEMICATVLGSESLRFGAGPLQSLIRDVDDKVESQCSNSLYHSSKKVRSILHWIGSGMDDKKIESTVFRGDYSQEEMKVNASYIRNARLAISQYITGDEVKVSFTKNIPKEFECLVRCYGSIGSVNNKPTVEVSLPIKLVNLINKCRRRLLRDTITERLYS